MTCLSGRTWVLGSFLRASPPSSRLPWMWWRRAWCYRPASAASRSCLCCRRSARCIGWEKGEEVTCRRRDSERSFRERWRVSFLCRRQAPCILVPSRRTERRCVMRGWSSCILVPLFICLFMSVCLLYWWVLAVRGSSSPINPHTVNSRCIHASSIWNPLPPSQTLVSSIPISSTSPYPGNDTIPLFQSPT